MKEKMKQTQIDDALERSPDWSLEDGKLTRSSKRSGS
jgi:hypothetical protein